MAKRGRGGAPRLLGAANTHDALRVVVLLFRKFLRGDLFFVVLHVVLRAFFSSLFLPLSLFFAAPFTGLSFHRCIMDFRRRPAPLQIYRNHSALTFHGLPVGKAGEVCVGVGYRPTNPTTPAAQVPHAPLAGSAEMNLQVSR